MEPCTEPLGVVVVVVVVVVGGGGGGGKIVCVCVCVCVGGGGGYVYWWPGSIICEDVYRLSDWIVYTWDRYVKYKWHPKTA